jgi:ABC-type glycerol-3-phosphate transport system substrate-binding protein
MGLQVGCEPAPADRRSEPLPYDGVRLTLSCPEHAFASAIAPLVNTWAARNGAVVTIAPTAMTAADSSDISVIPTGALGEWGESELLCPVPAKLRTGEQFQWQGLLPVYAERLAEWGGQALAVPITGDGYVIVYRADRFIEKSFVEEFKNRYGRLPGAPTTWEEFADLAETFTHLDKRPSLPPLPSETDRLFDLFSRVASSADRRALNDAELAANAARNNHEKDALAFQFSPGTGKPRILSHGFVRAASWLERLHAAHALPPAGPDVDDPARWRDDGPVLGLLRLDQLARLRENRTLISRFALGSVPGTRAYNDPDRPKTAIPQLNYVPYFSGGRLGVVRTRCPHPDAAFDLLAELGGPARSAELIATPGLGAGPTRTAHIDRDRLSLWFSYGFDEEKSKLLQDAIRQYIGPAVKNPTLGLRGPDREELVKATGGPLRGIAAGALSPNDGLKQIEDAWNALDAKVRPEKLLLWRQRGAGIN